MTDYCFYMSKIDLKTRQFILNPTDEQLENQFVCDLLEVNGCSSAKQKFNALWFWSKKYPNLKWTGTSLPDYLEGLISRAGSFQTTVEYEAGNFQIIDEVVYSTTLKNSYQTKSATILPKSFTLLNSNGFIVECHLSVDNKNKTYLSSVELILISSGTGQTTLVRLEIDMSAFKGLKHG